MFLVGHTFQQSAYKNPSEMCIFAPLHSFGSKRDTSTFSVLKAMLLYTFC